MVTHSHLRYGISKNQKSLFVKLDSWKVSQMVEKNCLSHGISRKWNIWLVEKRVIIGEIDFTWNSKKQKSCALCSRNIQNVNLRLDFVEIYAFYSQSDFTWNQIWVNANSNFYVKLNFGKFKLYKMSFLAISETPNFEFW